MPNDSCPLGDRGHVALIRVSERLRGFTVLTRCKTVEEFIDQFHDRTGTHHAYARTIFVHTVDARVVGTECGFALLLADKKPVLAGTCVVLDVFRDANNPFKRPGMRLGVKRLGPESESVFDALDAARELRAQPDTLVDTPPPKLDMPKAVPAPMLRRETQPLRVMSTEAISDGVVQAIAPRRTEPLGSRNLAAARTRTVQIPVVEKPAPRSARATSNVPPTDAPRSVAAEGSSATKTETRTPGSSIVLPANPLMNVDDASLEGLVDLGWGEPKPPPLPPPPPAPRAPSDGDVAYIHESRIVEPPAPPSIITVVLPMGVPIVVVEPEAPRMLARPPTPSAPVPTIAPPPPVVPRPMIELPVQTRSLRRPLAIAGALVAVAAVLIVVMRDGSVTAERPSLVVESSAEAVALHVRATMGLDPLPPAPPPPPAPNKIHAVFVQTYPIGARVTVNGRSFGTTPTYAKVPANTPIELHVARAGYPPIVHAMTSKTATDRVFLDLRKKRRR
jgi:hypothetical protein